jgi:hypothetical protein
MIRRVWTVLVVMAALVVPGVAIAQMSTGSLSGNVSYDGSGFPGVTVTAASPSMQGQRTTLTDENGNYVLPGLPPGVYTVSYQIEGFRLLEEVVKVSVAQTQLVDAVMIPEAVTGEVVVTDHWETVPVGVTGAGTVEQKEVDKLPVPRALESAVLLQAGTTTTGDFDQISISGGQSTENLFTMNGIVLNENVRNQPMAMFIEDAIQETTVLTSGISAEYGRFSGGVVNMITKSGGNEFSGSFRASFDNDDWTAKTPLTASRVDDVNQTYEATLGGRIWRDRLWFFAGIRDRSEELANQTLVTAIPFVQTTDNTRFELKLTGLLSQSQRLTAVYNRQDTPVENQIYPPIPPMAIESVDPSAESVNDGFALGYSGVLGSNFFIEAQYSQRDFSIIDSGGDDSSLTGGSFIWDLLNYGVFNAPWFCGEPCRDVERNNQNFYAKASWFISTENLGTHDLAFGVDTFDDEGVEDNHQSASDWYVFTWVPQDFSSGTPMAVFEPFGFGFSYSPIAEQSQGSSFKTNSAFVNDTWHASKSLTFNVGVRYDENDGTDAGGAKVVSDSRWSPRLGLTWDVTNDGRWVVNASAGRYVSAIQSSLANVGSAAGNPAYLQYVYAGPPVYASELGSNEAALDAVFDWFFNEYGGPQNPALLIYAWLPGLTPLVDEKLASPYADEFSLGLATRLGREGVLRADYVHREYGDFYAADTVPGRWTGSEITGPLDLQTLINDDSLLQREYDALMVRFQSRFGERWSVAGNYTLSRSWGNSEGESTSGFAVPSFSRSYMEYKDPSWDSPTGYLSSDQRHRLRAWAIWNAVMTERHSLSASALVSFLSGTPYSAVGTIDAAPTVAAVGNPGYIYPPSYLDYFFSDRGDYRTEDITSLDLALNYAFMLEMFGANLELFAEFDVVNVLNADGVIRVNSAVLTSINDPSLQSFNAMDEVPVEGVHWRKGDDFGQPISEDSFQQPRTYRLSVGVRF